ncbi:uncharacterized protein [Phyllobates terribilis]|uniref:uncharacterized protein n=1 Tax=Phyllobates terribilis TaxID=111132 RepID=UPI003CCAD413
MAGKLMQAVQYSGYGGGVAGLKHVEVAVPGTKADEVLIKLEATSLNPIDWKIQKGMLRPLYPKKFPVIPGTDIAGEIVQVGSGVTKFKSGDKVVAKLSHQTGGGLAEYAVAKESLTVIRPEEVSAAEGASLPVAALTAHQALTQVCGLKLDGTDETKNILITAGSGGVGTYAIQLAKLANAHVTTTCGARNMEFVKSLGADEVIDYRTPEGAALKSPSGKKYDYVINGMHISWSVFEPNLSWSGKVIDLNPGPSVLWTFAVKKITFSKKQMVPLMLSAKAENLEYLVGLVREKKLKSVVDSRFGLGEAEDAWEKIMSGRATGKIIVES